MKTATEISASFTVDDEAGEDWAEAATNAWLSAARDAGLTVDLHSTEVTDVNRHASVIVVLGAGRTDFYDLVVTGHGAEHEVSAAEIAPFEDDAPQAAWFYVLTVEEPNGLGHHYPSTSTGTLMAGPDDKWSDLYQRARKDAGLSPHQGILFVSIVPEKL